jgi:hypothetical protein
MTQKKKSTSAEIFTRLLVIQLLLPALVFAVLLFFISGIITLNLFEREQSNLVGSIGKILDDSLRDAKQILKIAAENADYADQSNLQRLLISSQSSSPYFATLFALDPQGIVYAFSPENPAELNSNHSKDPYFLLGSTSKEEVWISQPYLEKESGPK